MSGNSLNLLISFLTVLSNTNEHILDCITSSSYANYKRAVKSVNMFSHAAHTFLNTEAHIRNVACLLFWDNRKKNTDFSYFKS